MEYITPEIYKLMKYTYRHKEVTLAELTQKFGEQAHSTVCYLCSIQFGVIRKQDETLTLNTEKLSSRDKFGLMIPGEHYLWDRSTLTRNFLVPTIISIVALVLSVLTALFQTIVSM